MLQDFVRNLHLNKLVPDDGKIVVGVSGGADSIALLHLLNEFRLHSHPGLRLYASHLHHGLRGADADADAGFVSETAGRLGIECIVERRNIAALSASSNLGIEEASRNERHAFFERTCLRYGASTVAVAHHADDQAETVLLRVTRGTGLRGLGGMPAFRPLSQGSQIRLVRPLLGFTRLELREYLESNQIPFREDRSNTDPALLRNRVRHTVLPLLEQQVNPQVRGALIRLAEQARWFEDYFHENVARTFETLLVNRTDEAIVLNATALARKSRLLQTGLIREAYASFGLGEADLTFGHLVAVADLLIEHVSGKRVQLPGGVDVEKRYEQLIFTCAPQDGHPISAEQYVVHVPGRTAIPTRSMEIHCEVNTPDAGEIALLRNQGRRMSEHLDMDAVHPPLLIRPRRRGERFFPLGAPGTKKLSDYLTDAKVPPGERVRIVIVCDQLGPIWVVGHRIDDRVKLTAKTRRVLHLEARDLTP